MSQTVGGILLPKLRTLHLDATYTEDTIQICYSFFCEDGNCWNHWYIFLGLWLAEQGL